MKSILVVVASVFASLPAFSQNNRQPEALGLPGDNLNLYAVLDVFQKSKTLEDFEQTINDPKSNINNLDLNNDKNIDYLKVVSSELSNTHTIILQDVINSKETQDVAVIEVSKESSGKIYVQIIGDVDLYGKDYIVEPSDVANGTPNPGYSGGDVVTYENNYRPVRDWVIVSFLFSPVYVVYHSPYHWGYYPSYWHPWAPIYFENYWGYHRRFYGDYYFHRTVVYRNDYYYNNYVPRRNTSTVVIQNYRGGRYNDTYNGRTYARPEEPRRTDTPRRSETNVPRSENPRLDNTNNMPRPRNEASPRPNNDASPRQNNTVNPTRENNDVSPRVNNQNAPRQNNDASPRQNNTIYPTRENNDVPPRANNQNAPRQNTNDNSPRGNNNVNAPRPARSNPAPRAVAPSSPRPSRQESSGNRRNQ